MDWKPSAATIKEWGLNWERPYLEWLRALGQLPPLPAIEDTHRIFHGMRETLRNLHSAPAENLTAFFAGRFKTAYEVESHDMRWDTMQPSAKEVAVRTLVQEMLLWNGELSNAVVDDFFEKITKSVMQYGAPQG